MKLLNNGGIYIQRNKVNKTPKNKFKMIFFCNAFQIIRYNFRASTIHGYSKKKSIYILILSLMGSKI